MTIRANLSAHTNIVRARAHADGHVSFDDDNGTAALWLHGLPSGAAEAIADAFNGAIGAVSDQKEQAA